MWNTAVYTPEDLPQIIELTKSFYGDIEISNNEFLQWQYEKNPAGPAIITLAKDPELNLLAGQYVIIPMKLQHGAQTLRGTLSLNTLTRKEYWGQGIFTNLAEEAYTYCQRNGLMFTYGFPNPNSYPGFVKKLKFLDLGKVPLLLRPLDLKGLVGKKISPVLAPLAIPFKPIYNIGNFEISSLQVFELGRAHLPLIDHFWNKIKDKYPLMLVRDSAYIKWRYFDIPLREYTIYAIRKESCADLLGYIIGRCTEVSDLRSGMIVDFIVEPNNAYAGKALISHMLQHFKEKGMEISGSLMMPQTEEYRLLKGCGFFKCPQLLEPQPFPVVFRSHQKDLADEQPLLNLNNWFLTMGDYDVI